MITSLWQVTSQEKQDMNIERTVMKISVSSKRNECCVDLYVISCRQSAELADVVKTDPESDDETAALNPSTHPPCTPLMSRSLCFELSSTIVRTCSVVVI